VTRQSPRRLSVCLHPQGAPLAGSARPQGVVGGVRQQPAPAMGAVRAQGPGARGGVPAAAKAKQAYNQMAPPTNQYTADVAMAVAQNVVGASRAMPTPVTPPPPTPRPPSSSSRLYTLWAPEDAVPVRGLVGWQ